MKYIIFLSLSVVFVAVHARTVEERESIDALETVDRSADISSEDSDNSGRMSYSYYDDTGMDDPAEQDSRVISSVLGDLGERLKCIFSGFSIIKIVTCVLGDN